MPRPSSKELTERELEIMHVVWAGDDATAADVRDALAAAGRPLAHTTVATLLRILEEKNYVVRANAQRPFRYRATRSYEDVSRNILRDVTQRVFRGSASQLLVTLLEDRKLTAKERRALEDLLRESS